MRAWPVILCALLLLGAVWSASFISRSSFLSGGETTFSLHDDAMISMRYARNLARGDGLVWNPGERVEGISNPLWAGLMALLHLFPVAPRIASAYVQGFAALLLLGNVLAAARLAAALGIGSIPLRSLAVFLGAFHYPLLAWSLQGMEVGLLVLIVTTATAEAIHGSIAGTFPARAYLLFGVATLVRLDCAIYAVALAAWLAASDRRRPSRHLLALAAVLLVFVGGQTAARWSYYGEWLPNTYFLKLTGFPLASRLANGGFVAKAFLATLVPWLVILLLAGRRAWKRIGLPLALFGAALAYDIWVGGDAWEFLGGANRFLAPVMTSFVVALVSVFPDAGRNLRSAVPRGRWTAVPGLVEFIPAGVLGLLCLWGFVAANRTHRPGPWRDWLVLRPPAFTAGKSDEAARARLVRRLARPGARVAVVAAGELPYLTDLHAIDLLGKSDAYIARRPAERRRWKGSLLTFWPGHLKWDYGHSIGLLRPDVVVAVWWDPKAARRFLDRDYVELASGDVRIHVRRGSAQIRWDLALPLVAPASPRPASRSDRPVPDEGPRPPTE